MELRGVSAFPGFHPREQRPGIRIQVCRPEDLLDPSTESRVSKGKRRPVCKDWASITVEKQEFLCPRSASQHEGAEQPPPPR